MGHGARGLALLLCWAGIATADPHVFQGYRLDEALRLLQQGGLPIVFSSGIVTPSMRVAAEPRGTTPMQQLDELLKPHGLRAERSPGGVILVVPNPAASPARFTPKAAATRREPDTADAGTPVSAAEPTTYTDRVIVNASRRDHRDHGVSGTTVDGSTLQASSSVLLSGGLEAVHAMPRVAALDDFRSEFSVRGSPSRQIGIVIDGVATRWLQHTVYGRNDAGSLSMFGSDILDRATLQAGAYPRRYDDALGAQLELTLKEGSRESTRFAGTAGGTSAAFLGEGPLGSAGRGSWVAGVRNSYRSWPPRRWSLNDVGFAFADAYGKLVYDVSPTQQVSVTALGGRSTLDGVDEPLVGSLGTGTDRATLLTVGWRSTLGSQTVVNQHVFLVGQELLNTDHAGQLASRSSNRALGYRGEALHAMFGGLVEVGTEVARLSGARDVEAGGVAPQRDAFGETWTTRAAYVNYARDAPRGLSFDGGVRASDSTLVRQRALAPWIVGAWRFKSGWTVNASAGASRQFPELDAVLGLAGSSSLVPERATHVDLGLAQQLSRVQWQATVFNRVENDVLRRSDLQPRLVQGVVVDPPGPGQYRNSLHGASRGIELVVTPEIAARLSGWMSYAYAIARQTDIGTRETFWSDFDRRHTLNVAGVLRIGHQTSMGLVLRAASGAPIPGYFDVDNGRLFVGHRRNEARLVPYVRLDVRVQRTFLTSSHHPVTVLGEVLNALNRHNEGIAEGVVQPLTGEAMGFSRTLVPRRASIGFAVDLSR